MNDDGATEDGEFSFAIPDDYVPEAYRVEVICTDRGQHGQRSLATFVVRIDGTFDTASTRKAALPGAATFRVTCDDGALEDLPSGIGPRKVVGVDNRDDFDARRRWRFRCTTCGRDVPINEKTARTLVDAFASEPRRVVDVSLLPSA